jgi:hypothetical protein
LKKFLVLIILGFILSGCATYKFQKPATSGAKGYLACYDDKPILEYTVGKENSLPDITLAKERFKRRRLTVEYYYKQMDVIESRLKEFFWDPPAMLADLLGGLLRWPFTAVADYKYNRNPEYKERVDKLDEQKEELEKVRVSALKEKLAAYIVADLNKESSTQDVVKTVPVVVSKFEPAQEISQATPALPVTQKVVPKAEAPVVQETVSQTLPVGSAPASVIEPLKEIKPIVGESPVAVIIAKPAKGSSPLIVKFSGQKSYSKSGKIASYLWDFGDGDVSSKKDPENTYWSTTFGLRNFTVTLTVRDDAGNTSTSSTIIGVITK